MPGALDTLRWHYEHRFAEALAQHQAGVPVVGYTSNTVPWELIRAAGCFPVLLAPDPGAPSNHSPLTGKLMEPMFESRIRGIFDGILSGAWKFLELLIIPRTSEPEYKLYLYLREVARQELNATIPPLWLYDLLHTRSPISRTYGLDRTKALLQRLNEIHPVHLKSVSKAVADSNRARAALIKLKALRSGATSQISGTDALTVTGAFYFMDRATFAKLAETACREARSAKPLRGPRLLIKGTPLHHPKLHQALEAHGAMVSAEDDWWGARATDRKILPTRTLAAATRAIFENYYLHAPSPRVSPVAASDAWFRKAVKSGADAVVFYLPPDDDIYGWDYPRQRDFAHACGVPSLLIREDAGRGLSGDAHTMIKMFVGSLQRNRHAAARV
jgi:benzoyl-CoA reductase/2-hydroxyglutaryl-CoA dehydratase subunit BcrC/BadD/HgdB